MKKERGRGEKARGCLCLGERGMLGKHAGSTNGRTWKMRRVPDPLGKSTPISAARLRRTTTLQPHLCIEHHTFLFQLFFYLSYPSLNHPTPATSPHCKVRVAEFKSQSECRLSAPRVYIGHPFCLYLCLFHDAVDTGRGYVCMCFFMRTRLDPAVCARDCWKFLPICENPHSANAASSSCGAAQIRDSRMLKWSRYYW